jgi:hypothetical protein
VDGLDAFADNRSLRHSALYETSSFRALLHRFAGSFMLVVAIQDPPCTRRVLKFSYDEPLTLRYKLQSSTSPSVQDSQTVPEPLDKELRLGHPRSIVAMLGWQPTRLRFPVPAAENCSSYHLEVEAPPDLRIAEASLLAGRPRSEAADRPLSFDRVAGGFPKVDLHVADVPRGSVSQAQIALHVAREGWLSTAVVATLATTLLLWSLVAAVHWLTDRVFGSDTGSDAAVTVLTAVIGALATILVRPAEHKLASRMLMPLRMAAIVAAALPFIASAVLLAAPPESSASRGIYILLAAISTPLFLLLLTAWLIASPSRIKQVISPWEQGVWVSKIEAAKNEVGPVSFRDWLLTRRRLPDIVREYNQSEYQEAREVNGYEFPAILVASSEPQRDAQVIASWDDELEGEMNAQLRSALAGN